MCVCLYVALQAFFAIMTLQRFLLIHVVLSVIIAVLNVCLLPKTKMPTINFSTPEQPPGDTRRKVSHFLGSSTGASAWRQLVELCVFFGLAHHFMFPLTCH